MAYTLKRKLEKLNNRQFADDIKKYIKSSHDFYKKRSPELKTLAKRLHQEHELKDFYKIFNKLWNSSTPSENSLALHTLELYKDEFNLDTWRFLKPKLKTIKNQDHADSISKNIIGVILLKHPRLKNEITNLSKSREILIKRISIISMIPVIQDNKTNFPIEIAKRNLYHSETSLNESVGIILKDIGKKDKDLLKKFILKHMDMPEVTFKIATENLKDLRKLKKIKKLKPGKLGMFFFWRA